MVPISITFEKVVEILHCVHLNYHGNKPITIGKQIEMQIHFVYLEMQTSQVVGILEISNIYLGGWYLYSRFTFHTED